MIKIIWRCYGTAEKVEQRRTIFENDNPILTLLTWGRTLAPGTEGNAYNYEYKVDIEKIQKAANESVS